MTLCLKVSGSFYIEVAKLFERPS